MRERLLTRETVFLGRSAKKVLQKYYSFGTEIAEGKEGEAGEAMRCELGLFGIEISKTSRTVAAWMREVDEISAARSERQERAQELREEISRLQASLETARQIGQNKRKCEAVARRVLALPSVQSSNETLKELEEQSDEIARELADSRQLLRSQSNNYALLLQCVRDLTNNASSSTPHQSRTVVDEGEIAEEEDVVMEPARPPEKEDDDGLVSKSQPPPNSTTSRKRSREE